MNGHNNQCARWRTPLHNARVNLKINEPEGGKRSGERPSDERGSTETSRPNVRPQASENSDVDDVIADLKA
ncbi:MAG: hypothetical protein A2762_01670 [Candidatus Lloydbacteria bacterium RIFCSPHIGHO2_01_FULL_54_11]|nr:MAG: hypothetical protein A2762_01670 [Candidatus Lloydbacteria bacterium RIFCSPHIGHO2_01_FULL_54_11]